MEPTLDPNHAMFVWIPQMLSCPVFLSSLNAEISCTIILYILNLKIFLLILFFV